MDDPRDYAEEAYWRRYCPEHDTDHLERGRCPVDNVTMEIRGQLELAVEARRIENLRAQVIGKPAEVTK